MNVAAEVELLEADAWAQMHTLWAERMPASRARTRRLGRATALATPTVDALAVNRALGLGLERPLDAEQIAELTEFYRDAGRTRWFLDWSPDAQLAHPRVLEDLGVLPRLGNAKLFAEIIALPAIHPDGEVTVTRITEREADTFVDIVAPAYGIPAAGQAEIASPIDQPGWYYYLAFVDGHSAAGAAMYVNDAGAWLGFAATREAFRDMGAQTALLCRRIDDARSLGCRWVSAEAFPNSLETNPSLRNMTRLGMRVTYQRPFYRVDL